METTWLARSFVLLTSIALCAIVLVACDDDLPVSRTNAPPIPPSVASVAPHLETAGALLDELDDELNQATAPPGAADRLPPPEEMDWDPTQGFPTYPMP